MNIKNENSEECTPSFKNMKCERNKGSSLRVFKLSQTAVI